MTVQPQASSPDERSAAGKDLHPTSDGTQIFTIIYILTGLGILVSLLAAVAEQYVTQKADRTKLRERVKARRTGSAEEDA